VNQTLLLSDGIGSSSLSSSSNGQGNSGSSSGIGGVFMSIEEGETHFDATIRALREFQNSSKTTGTIPGPGPGPLNNTGTGLGGMGASTIGHGLDTAAGLGAGRLLRFLRMSHSRGRSTNSRMTVGLADDKDEITLLGHGSSTLSSSLSQGQGQWQGWSERDLIKRTLLRTFIDRR
jgi:hypothetical protein